MSRNVLKARSGACIGAILGRMGPTGTLDQKALCTLPALRHPHPLPRLSHLIRMVS